MKGWRLFFLALFFETGKAQTADPSLLWDFQYTGSSATYTVPSGIRLVQVIMCGGIGGLASYNPTLYSGGLGGFVSANITVTPGQTLCVSVGQRGGNNPGPY